MITHFDPDVIGLKVGLEVHQQLDTRTKLFCSCSKFKEDKYTNSFLRQLRPTQSELGEVDQAALFEFKKHTFIKYLTGEESSCLVETDEEPPHDLNMDAVESAIIVALSLNSKVLDEIHVMRKIVIDGSNTTGFQRTVVVALGGELKTGDISVPVQAITVEEDAAKLIGNSNGIREYALDRLGVPLIEVTLAPYAGDPAEIQQIALSLGRLMRTTKRVARGLGTVRQDLNISIANGPVTEVKGVQKLDLLLQTIEYESIRHKGLLEIAERLHNRNIKPNKATGPARNITHIFKKKGSSVILKAVSKGGKVYGFGLKGFKGLLSMEPYPNVRLGAEMSDLARFYGLGGILHSDELPNSGIMKTDVENIRKHLELDDEDAFVVMAGKEQDVLGAIEAISNRVGEAVVGVPAETRGPTPDGRTRYIRPRAGAARMYPETDISPILITREMLQRLTKDIPLPWEEQVHDHVIKYGLSEQLAARILDSQYAQVFEYSSSSTRIQPSFIAATLTETLLNLAREGMEISSLSDDLLNELFQAIDSGHVSKEFVPQVLKTILANDALSIKEAVSRLGIISLTDAQLVSIIDTTVSENLQTIREKGDRSFKILMGIVMKKVRGRADGKKISNLLMQIIKKNLK